MPDLTIPRAMPPEVEHRLRTVLGFRNQPTPVEITTRSAIREALEAQSGRAPQGNPPESLIFRFQARCAISFATMVASAA